MSCWREERRLLKEPTDKEGRERENKERERRWAADTAADGKIDGTCMNERTADGRGHGPTARRSVGRYGDERNRFENPG